MRNTIRFQKTLALFAYASCPAEAEAAELAARRLMQKFNIDPLTVPDVSLYSRDTFANNQLLAKLRAEQLAKPEVQAATQKKEARSARARKAATTRARNEGRLDSGSQFDGLFDD